MNIKVINILFFILFVSTVFSCGISTESLARQVQEDLIEHYKENGKEIVFTQKLILTHKGGNEYIGFVDVSLDGEKTRISLDVLYDGKSYQAEWRATRR
jgi:hypothetical protein